MAKEKLGALNVVGAQSESSFRHALRQSESRLRVLVLHGQGRFELRHRLRNNFRRIEHELQMPSFGSGPVIRALDHPASRGARRRSHPSPPSPTTSTPPSCCQIRRSDTDYPPLPELGGPLNASRSARDAAQAARHRRLRQMHALGGA
jgi:hypothetical protein